MRITSGNQEASEQISAGMESLHPHYIYVSHWDSGVADLNAMLTFRDAGLPAFQNKSFCILAAPEIQPGLVRTLGWEVFPHYDAYWFLNDLDQLREAPPFIPWSATKDNPPQGAETWADVEIWMVENGIFYGVLWIEHGADLTLTLQADG